VLYSTYQHLAPERAVMKNVRGKLVHRLPRLLRAAAVVLGSLSACSHTPNDLIIKGDEYLQEHDYESAGEYYRGAQDLAGRESDNTVYFQARGRLLNLAVQSRNEHDTRAAVADLLKFICNDAASLAELKAERLSSQLSTGVPEDAAAAVTAVVLAEFRARAQKSLEAQQVELGRCAAALERGAAGEAYQCAQRVVQNSASDCLIDPAVARTFFEEMACHVKASNTVSNEYHVCLLRLVRAEPPSNRVVAALTALRNALLVLPAARSAAPLDDELRALERAQRARINEDAKYLPVLDANQQTNGKLVQALRRRLRTLSTGTLAECKKLLSSARAGLRTNDPAKLETARSNAGTVAVLLGPESLVPMGSLAPVRRLVAEAGEVLAKSEVKLAQVTQRLDSAQRAAQERERQRSETQAQQGDAAEKQRAQRCVSLCRTFAQCFGACLVAPKNSNRSNSDANAVCEPACKKTVTAGCKKCSSAFGGPLSAIQHAAAE
jgi:hypothetical protein